MANVNRPGVYIEEVSSANTPIAPVSADSVAVFVGYTDRGPVTGTKNSYVGKPTLVTGWDDFCAKFSFKTDAFTTIPTYSVTPSSTVTNTTTITISTNTSLPSDPAYSLYVGSTLPAVGSTSGSTTLIPAGTYITGITGTNSFTVNNLVNISNTTPISVGTNLPFKYALQSFFDNGGSSAYILRDVPNDADKASAVFVDQSGSQTINTASNALTYLYATAPTGVTATSSVTSKGSSTITVVGTVTNALGATISGTGIADGTTITNVASQVLTLSTPTTLDISAGATLTFTANLVISSASGTPFVDAEVGRVVSLSGVTGTFNTGTTPILASTNSYVIASKISSTKIALSYISTTPVAADTQSTGSVIINGASVSTQAALTISAIEPGIWGNNIWVGITPGTVTNTFNLSVYYSTATTAATVLNSVPLETYLNCSMNPSDANNKYVLNLINGVSNYITVANSGSGNLSLPAFTVGWNPAKAVTSTGVFSWSSSYTQSLASGDSLIRCGNTTATKSSLAGTTGKEGSVVNSLLNVTLPKLDEVNVPLIINYPYKSDANTISALATYAANRSDSFVVADYPLLTASGTNSSTTSDVLTAINQWNTNTSYVATYYPALAVADNTTYNTPINISPSGAVIGQYVKTDTSRGVFKAPAGSSTVLAGGYTTAVGALPSSDYDLINGNKNNLNIIRYIPGSGYCIMGARTVDNSNSLVRYVSVRRTLGLIEYDLKQLTLFAVFEPNDQNLWNSITSQLTGYFNDLWRRGGLTGTAENQAYYVKCDSTNNTSTSINNGQLNIEVGVALGRPAEFIVIRVSQISGSTTVTTSI